LVIACLPTRLTARLTVGQAVGQAGRGINYYLVFEIWSLVIFYYFRL
jgi:hypothetical protein